MKGAQDLAEHWDLTMTLLGQPSKPFLHPLDCFGTSHLTGGGLLDLVVLEVGQSFYHEASPAAERVLVVG